MKILQFLKDFVDIYKEFYTDIFKDFIKCIKSVNLRLKIYMMNINQIKYKKILLFILKPFICNNLKNLSKLPVEIKHNNVIFYLNFKYNNITNEINVNFIADEIDKKQLSKNDLKKFYDSIGHLIIIKSLYKANIDTNFKTPIQYYEIPKVFDNSFSLNRSMYIFNYGLIFNVTC